MKLTRFEKPVPKRKVRTSPGRKNVYSNAHIRMFGELRSEGYSWGQIGEICGVSKYSARTALERAMRGIKYPEVTTTVLKFNRGVTGPPKNGRSDRWVDVTYQHC